MIIKKYPRNNWVTGENKRLFQKEYKEAWKIEEKSN